MKRFMGALASAAFVLGACGSDAAEPPRVGSGAGPCADRSGATFLVKIVERAGTCGLGTTEVVVQSNASTGAGCTGTATDSADKCETSFDTDCPSKAEEGARVKEVGKVKWSQDGSFGSGVETVAAVDRNGNSICGSTVDVTYTRQ